MDDIALGSALESILFASEKPVTIDRFREAMGDDAPKAKRIEKTLDTLCTKYEDSGFGFEIRKAQGGYQFSTKKENARWVRKFLEMRPFKLSRSALETLAVIAYRQPITRAEIDNVRGIDSSHLLRTLIEKGIVKMAGKADVPGRPVQYATTPKFLDLTGLKSTSELPPLSELKELEGDAPSAQDRLEDDMSRFVDAEDLLEDRSKELEEGLKDIDGIIKSAGRVSKEVYPSALHAEIAAENEDAVAGFQAISRGWKKPKKKQKESLEASENAAQQDAVSPETQEATPEEEAPIASDEPTTEEKSS